jgi:sugar phosphate isomerase/epimerase
MQLTLEFMPFSNIPTLAAAREAIVEVGRDNVGLLLDVWHVARSGEEYAELATLPPYIVNYVEIDDAVKTVNGSLFEDTIYHRLLPGEGDLNVATFLQTVRDIGYSGPIGVEVISREQSCKPLVLAAKDALAATRAEMRKSAVQAR